MTYPLVGAVCVNGLVPIDVSECTRMPPKPLMNSPGRTDTFSDMWMPYLRS